MHVKEMVEGRVGQVDDGRFERAQNEQFIVYQVSPELFLVKSQSGEWYNVDLKERQCDCPDNQYRNQTCKHMIRAVIAHEQERTVIV